MDCQMSHECDFDCVCFSSTSLLFSMTSAGRVGY
jgi:hypothetical protein